MAPKRRWDESKVRRDAGGRFSSGSGRSTPSLTGSGHDKYNDLRAQNQSLGSRAFHGTAHSRALNYVDQVNTNARLSPGYSRHERGFIKIRAVGNAPLATPKGRAHLQGHASRSAANEARTQNKFGNNNRSLHRSITETNNARGKAALSNSSRRTTQPQKTAAQRKYEAANRRFQAKLRKQGFGL